MSGVFDSFKNELTVVYGLKRPLSVSIFTTIIGTFSIARYSNGDQQPPLSVDSTVPTVNGSSILNSQTPSMPNTFYKPDLYILEEVSKTKYLGTTVTRDNLIEEEINERIGAN